MHRQSRATKSLFAIAILLVAASGCADPAPTAPAAPVEASRPVQAGLITLDLEGGEWGVDLATQELRLPDGRIVDLSVEETELFATEFLAQSELAARSAFIAETYTSLDCNWHYEECPGDQLRASPAPPTSLGPIALRAGSEESADSRPDRTFERKYGKFRIRFSRQASGSFMSLSEPTVVFVLDGYSCADVREAMNAARAEAATRRTGWRAALDLFISWTGFSVESGTLRGEFDPSARAAAEAAVESLDTQRVSMALSMLSGLYNQMGCNLGTFNGGSEPAPAGWSKTCTQFWGTVALGDGVVISGWLTECKYVREL